LLEKVESSTQNLKFIFSSKYKILEVISDSG